MRHRAGPKGGKITGPDSVANSGVTGEGRGKTNGKPLLPPKPNPAPKASAFDVWLERGLHSLFDAVANEPIPPELLQLIEDDRRKLDDDKTK